MNGELTVFFVCVLSRDDEVMVTTVKAGVGSTRYIIFKNHRLVNSKYQTLVLFELDVLSTNDHCLV